MLRIGEFAALTRISIRMLRHYDEIGLLKPAIVDQFTSYRYYTLDQLPRLHRILALKELGLSLEQIATLLNEDLPAEQIRGMLRLKQIELQQHIQEEQERLARVEARIRRIEMEGKMPDREAVVKQVPPIRVLSFREITNEVGGQFDLAFGAIGRDGNVKLNGPAMALYYHDSDTAELDTEIALPVPDVYSRDVPIDEKRVMTVRTIPAATVASMQHQGGYDFEDTYAALSRWIVERGYSITGPAIEIYVRSMLETPNEEELLTEIQFVIGE